MAGFGCVLLICGLLAWKLFPSEERVIRKRLSQLANTISLKSGENLLRRIAKARKVPEFFATNVVINISAAAPGYRNIEGREQVSEVALAAQGQLQQLQVKFLDIVVDELIPRQSATVRLTLVVDLNGEANVIVQELKMTFRKQEKEWVISQVEPMKTLQ